MKDKRFRNKNNCICYFNSSENKWYIESSNLSLKFSSESDHPFSKFVNVSNPSQEIKNFPGKISFSDTEACNGTFTITGFDENNIPIYIQLVEQLKIYIISGEIKPGERLSSVRDLALQTKVNPNTMQKALVELEELSLVYTERTNGKYVTTDTSLIDKYKERLLL